MAKYPKKRSRKGRSRRGPYKKRRNTIKGVSRKLDKLYSAIEVKHYDQSFVNQQVLNTGFVLGLTGPNQGLSELLRIGDKITTTSVQLRLVVEQVDPYRNNMRVIVLKIRGNSADAGITAAAMKTKIFSGTAITTGFPFLWKYNLDYFRSSGAKILFDRHFNLAAGKVSNNAPTPDAGGWGDGVGSERYISKKIMHRQNIQFTDGGAQHNHQLLLLAYSETNLAAIAPHIHGSFRINYIDL